jgi:hypothetical protein
MSQASEDLQKQTQHLEKQKVESIQDRAKLAKLYDEGFIDRKVKVIN